MTNVITACYVISHHLHCRWLESIRDWCISRQLWWGHRIPAWYVCLEGDESSVAGTMSEHLDRYANICLKDILFLV